jgi:chromosome segregation ATPase
MRTLIISGAFLLVACSQHHTLTKVDDSGLARLDEQNMQPVDDARVEEGRAQDAVARARANEADARARYEVAKSEKSVAEAQLKRSAAERDLLKKQYAPRDQIAQAEQNIQAAQDRVKATDFKLAYLNQMIAVSEAERKTAEAHVATAHAATEQAKYRAMRAGNAPQAQSVNPGDLDKQLADARSAEANAQKAAADQRSKAMALYNKWEAADASARTMAQPQNIPVPPPISEPSK